MRRFLHARVTAKRFDEVAALVVGVVLLAGCTASTLLALGGLSSGTAFVVGTAIGGAWMVLAQITWHLRRC